MDSKEKKKTLTISSNFKKKKIDVKPFNNIKGAPNPPTKLSGRGHSYSSDLSKQGSKIILGDN